MWFKLDLDGIVLQLRITGYKEPTVERWDCEWCRVDLTLQSGDWLDYHVGPTELLVAAEVKDLRDCIDALLTDRIEKPKELGFIEPDLEFQFTPKQDARENPRVLYVRPGSEIVDIGMEMVVYFWNDGLTDNRLIVSFIREDLEKLLCYLQYVTGSISKDSTEVANLLAEGYMYE